MIKQRVSAFALALLGIAVFVKTVQESGAGDLEQSAFNGFSLGGPFGFAVAGILFATALVLLLTSFDVRQQAVLRLDWFLPALRRLKTGQDASKSVIGKWLRSVVPASMQSNRQTKKRGPLRKLVRRFGISWQASPIRRMVQGICLTVFLGLFFYTLWPYGAVPVTPRIVGQDWTFSEIDAESGEIVLQNDSTSDIELSLSQTVYLVPDQTTEMEQQTSAKMEVAGLEASEIRLTPDNRIPAPFFDALLQHSGTWTFYDSDPNAWPSHYADHLQRKEVIAAELFLVIDPLVSLSTAIASRSWVWSLAAAGIILLVCVLIPRGFCGYLCPLGTTIDLFDWAIGKRVDRFRVSGDGWWVHIKYYLLAGTLLCAVGGVLVSGFFSAIPVITRGMLFFFEPLQIGLLRGTHLVPPIHLGHVISIGMFFAVLGLGFLRPRFWCKYVCPSGAVFSISNLFRVTERKVESSCINCNKCVEICPFDAIKPDFTTRTSDCTLCQSCGGVCPTHAIKFVERWNVVELKVPNDPPTDETKLGRRGFLSLSAGTAAAVTGASCVTLATKTFGANLDDPASPRPVRPPGSVPEKEFLEMCIRCGECFKACPNNVLQAEGFQQGLEGLWTPMVNADWAGCESSCNACGQVCPTGAIRALPIQEKRVARMGLAIVNEATCLPYAGREECDLCVQECNAAGYHAIEFEQVRTDVDDTGNPIPGTGFSAPVVLADKCVGCGLCQTRCNGINTKERGVLTESAIIVEAGEGKEDRLMSGSYIKLREQERRSKTSSDAEADYFVPNTVVTDPGTISSDAGSIEDDNPFGISAPESVQPSVEDDGESDPFGLLD